MKACFVMQSLYSRGLHAIALILKEKYGVNEFCAYISTPWAEKFIKNQTDINYDPILVDHEIHAKFKQEKIDLPYLKYFEETYAPPNAWLYLYRDRKLMLSMGPKEESTSIIDPLYPHEGLMKAFQVRAKAIESMLKEAKPNFILFFTIGSISQLLIFHIAKKLGIKTFNLDFGRIRNKINISEDYKTLTGVEEEFKKFQKEKNPAAYRNEASKIIDNFRKTGSLNLEYVETEKSLTLQNKSMPKMIKALNFIKFIFNFLINYIKYRHLFLYHTWNQNPLLFIFYKLKRQYRSMRGLSDLYSKLNFEEDYAFFALHYEPEQSIQTLSPFYFDQTAVIGYIARSLPLHYKLYVKEHPSMINARPRKFYKELLKIPSVKLINQKIGSFEIIKHSKLVATITGTAGWEAVLLDKPVITFGNVFYNNLSCVKRVREIENLPNIINEQLYNFKPDEEEIVDIVAAILKDSVDLNYSSLRTENDLEKIENDKDINNFCEALMKKARQD